jgi:menaquinone-dependent protoporphyrinogen IX oxidase
MSHILVLFDVATADVATWIAGALRTHGHVTELVRADGDIPSASKFDAVVVGSRVFFGHHAQPIIDYVSTNRAELEAMPTALFTVGAEGAYRMGTVRTLGWQPHETVSFPVFTDEAHVTEFAERFHHDLDVTTHLQSAV